MNHTIYEGDVLEHALNFGLSSSAKRYSIPRSEVKKIVLDFQKDIGDTPVCLCVHLEEGARFLSPSILTCMQCTAFGVGNRILISKFS